MKQYVPLVGMRYRKPALAFTANLKQGHPLVLRKEPENEYDNKAIAVYLDRSTLTDEQTEVLKGPLAAFGSELGDLPLLIHLGYVARTETESIHSCWPVRAEFALGANGFPAVAFEPQEIRTSEEIQ